MRQLTLTAMASVMAWGVSAVAQAEIRLGATVSATGPASYLGDPEAKTLEMLTEKINAAGGVNGDRIKLVLYDDGGDPNKARTFATRLVEDDKVVAIIGGSTTGASMSIIPVCLLLDEPSMGLAPILVQQILDVVKNLKALNVTVLLVEQNAYAALKIADRGYVMETGRISMTATAQELIADQRIRRAYLGI